MGNDISTARSLAPSAFAINLAAQLYGMFSSPNMKEIADKVSSFLSIKSFQPLKYYTESLCLLPKPSLHRRILRPSNGSSASLDQKTLQWRGAVR